MRRDGGPRPARTLSCHPSSSAPHVRGIAADVERVPPGVLHVTFVLDGDLDRLAIPAFERPRPGIALWQHTCFEVFVQRADRAAYHELNLSPSGAWQAHAFAAYRDGGPLGDDTLAPHVTVARRDDTLTLHAEI